MMRISRITKETSRITQIASPTKRSTRLQARNFAQSLTAYAANGASVQKNEEVEENIKQENITGDDSSELSSADSTFSADIEDFSVPLTASRKRKRDATSSTLGTSISAPNAGPLPRKVGDRSLVQSSKKSRKAKKQPAKKVVEENGEVKIHPPPNWEEMYDAVKEMRKTILAPVDTMGCETLAEEHVSPRVRPPFTGQSCRQRR